MEAPNIVFGMTMSMRSTTISTCFVTCIPRPGCLKTYQSASRSISSKSNATMYLDFSWDVSYMYSASCLEAHWCWHWVLINSCSDIWSSHKFAWQGKGMGNWSFHADVIIYSTSICIISCVYLSDLSYCPYAPDTHHCTLHVKVSTYIAYMICHLFCVHSCADICSTKAGNTIFALGISLNSDVSMKLPVVFNKVCLH